MGFSLLWLLLLWSTGSGVRGLQQLRCMGSVVAAHGAILEATRGASTVAASAFSERGHTELQRQLPSPGFMRCLCQVATVGPFQCLAFTI